MSGAWTQIVSICVGINAICIVGGLLIRAVLKVWKPIDDRDKKLKELEAEIERVKERLDGDKDRLDLLDEGNRVTQRALLALLSHGIDGNEVESMRKAKEELQEYLIRR